MSSNGAPPASEHFGREFFNSLFRRKKAKTAGPASHGGLGDVTEPLWPCVESPVDWGTVALLFLFPALGGALYGYDVGATSGASLSLTSAEASGTDWYNLALWQNGLVVSGSLYGALSGSILAYNVADVLGRRRELILSVLFYGAGILMTAFANSLPLLIVGRLIFGVGIGLAMHAAPMYIAETSPSKIRGALISSMEAFFNLGVLLGYLVGFLEIDTFGGWRVMYGSAFPIALVMGIGMLSLPPSPRWLLLSAVQGKEMLAELRERAAAAIRRCGNSRATDEAVEVQLEETLASLEAAEEITLGELFTGVNLKALTVGAGLVFFQQVTGQPSVLYYAAPILEDAGFSGAGDATKISVLLGFFKLLMTGIAVLSVDKLGRRPLLITGVSGMVVSLFLLAFYFSFGQGFPALAVISLLLYVGCYQVSFGPVSWLIVSEIFPLRARGRALSLTAFVNFTFNALVAFTLAPLQGVVGDSFTFIVFGVMGVASLAFIVASIPETKGLSLEEIQAKLLDRGAAIPKDVKHNKKASFSGDEGNADKAAHMSVTNAHVGESSVSDGTSFTPHLLTVDEIKLKYDRPPSAGSQDVQGAAKEARQRMAERGGKLQALSHKTQELESEAESFASMAEQLANKMVLMRGNKR